MKSSNALTVRNEYNPQKKFNYFDNFKKNNPKIYGLFCAAGFSLPYTIMSAPIKVLTIQQQLHRGKTNLPVVKTLLSYNRKKIFSGFPAMYSSVLIYQINYVIAEEAISKYGGKRAVEFGFATKAFVNAGLDVAANPILSVYSTSIHKNVSLIQAGKLILKARGVAGFLGGGLSGFYENLFGSAIVFGSRQIQKKIDNGKPMSALETTIIATVCGIWQGSCHKPFKTSKNKSKRSLKRY